MTTKQPTAAERLAAIAKGETSVVGETEKTEKKPKYIKKGGNGGARPNSGRKPEEERKAEKRQGWQDFSETQIKVKLADESGVVKERKMTRTEITRLKLFSNVLKGDMRAIEEFNERDMGRAMQPIGGSDTEPLVVRIDF